jgi:aspartyl-tRNA(Asn)/glutamyl-tRNA(Gln) amidotransferase subunit A
MNADATTADLAFLSIPELAAHLASGAITSRCLTELYLSRIKKHEKLNAFITVMREEALKAADASDQRRVEGRTRGPLDGIPVALKDNIDVAGVPTTAGIEARRKHIAAADAPVAARLKNAGAVILGKLNMHEGAHGATTANDAYGYCYNPHREAFTPGGSSGGSGSAVAAGLCAAAVGTDTLGSIRIPASFCGITGIKPTQGLVSTRGVVPLAFSLDNVGPMARHVIDLALMLEAMAGPDTDDPFSIIAQAPPQAAFSIPESLKGVRIGRLRDLDEFAADKNNQDVALGYEAALAQLARLGADIIDVALEGYKHNAIRPKAMLVIEADLAVVFGKALEENPLGFSQIFRDGIAYGQQQSAPKLALAFETIRSVKPIANRMFADIDAFVTPTTPCPAFSFQTAMPKTLTAFTALANYIGAPAVSVPMGITKDNLPMGLQIMTRPGHDIPALKIAGAYERSANPRLKPSGY